MMLRIGPQIDAAESLPRHLLRRLKSELLLVKGSGGLDVLNVNTHRPDLHDFERSREQHAVDVEARFQRIDPAIAAVKIDALVERLLNLSELVDLRQLGS